MNIFYTSKEFSFNQRCTVPVKWLQKYNLMLLVLYMLFTFFFYMRSFFQKPSSEPWAMSEPHKLQIYLRFPKHMKKSPNPAHIVQTILKTMGSLTSFWKKRVMGSWALQQGTNANSFLQYYLAAYGSFIFQWFYLKKSSISKCSS